MSAPMLNIFQQIDHAILPNTTHDERARQEFTKSFKQFIQQGLLPGLGPVFAGRAAPQFESANGQAPESRRDIRQAMIDDPYFQAYASANRVSQELLWDAVIDSIERQHEQLIDQAKTLSAKNGAPLKTDPNFEAPNYVTSLDIHCMPGGYATENTEDDILAGALYDRGVYLYAMGYMGPFNDDMGRSVCNYIKRQLNGFEPKRILDMGCTVGHSTLPFKELFPDAEVIGIDVAGPCVRYAHARAASMNLDVGFMQQDAANTEFEDESFDLVVSHILLHETSGKAMPQIFKECYRLLKPGGYMIHADLPPFDKMDNFAQFILDNETYYNNEPFWGAMRELDQVALSKDAGFAAESVKFDNAPMAIMEFVAQQDQGYTEETAENVADRDFEAGEFAPGGGWEVLVAQK